MAEHFSTPDEDNEREEKHISVIWTDVLEEIKKKANPQVQFWFDKLSLQSQTDSSVTLLAKSSFDRDWIKNNYIDMIRETLSDVQGRKYDVFVNSERDTPTPPPTQIGNINKLRIKETLFTGIINPNYNFERFVVGPSNQFAHAASIAVARNPGQAYNPLFIYGGVGLGKTHLLNAIGNYVIANQPSSMARICCISAEHFTNQVINSIKKGKMEELRNRYRFGCDVLMIDDIQFIAGKESTQEEFFHTFNSLYELKKQIVLTSDKTPKDLPQTEERLRSRFEWGVITDIQTPETETKVAILENKAEQEGIVLPKEVALYIAENITSNIRELEGTLTNISAYAKLLHTKITLDLAKGVLKNIVKEAPAHVINISAIQREVSQYFGLKPQDLKSVNKTKQIALPRHLAMYLSRKLTGASFPEIGDKFGGKDHSTIIHAVKKIESLLEKDPMIKKTIDLITLRVEERRG